MRWFVKEITDIASSFNAGSKARLDVEEILLDTGFQPIEITSDWSDTERKDSRGFKKIAFRIKAFRCWESILEVINDEDILLIQLPIEIWTEMDFIIYKRLKKRNVKIIGFVHDIKSLRINTERLKSLRRKKRIMDERRFLRLFDYVVVPNEITKEYCTNILGCKEDRLKVLGIYDYLLDDIGISNIANKSGPIVIAGNLSPQKAGYVYHELPMNLTFSLYGESVSGQIRSNITYVGKYLPNELPGVVIGSYGLVWDGNSTETCDGCYGEYMKYNTPHKLSMYLVAGLPVIIWSKAAMARFVSEYNCGFSIDSLSDLQVKLNAITSEQYEEFVRNSIKIQSLLRKGYFTRKVLNNIVE